MIDSLFSDRNAPQTEVTLKTVSHYQFQNGVLKSYELFGYDHDTIRSWSKTTCDSNGNMVEWYVRNLEFGLTVIRRIKRDQYGNLLKVGVVDPLDTFDIQIQNTYDNGLLINQIHKIGSKVIEDVIYSYDNRAQLVKTYSPLQSYYNIELRRYNRRKQLLTVERLQDSVLQQRESYRYKRNFLIEHWEEVFNKASLSSTTMRRFEYDKRKRLTHEWNGSHHTQFSGFDHYDNWTRSESYDNDKLIQISSRTYVYN